jgi:hypothetical protein
VASGQWLGNVGGSLHFNVIFIEIGRNAIEATGKIITAGVCYQPVELFERIVQVHDEQHPHWAKLP